MTDAEFWKLISLIDVQALDRGDEQAAVRPLHTVLCSGYREPDLMEFEEALAQKLYALDGELYAENAGESGGSDDAFLYARLYVVAKGQGFYESVLADPVKMPKSINQWCESLLYVPRYAWQRLTGKDASGWPYSPSVSFESGRNEKLW